MPVILVIITALFWFILAMTMVTVMAWTGSPALAWLAVIAVVVLIFGGICGLDHL